MLSQGRQPNGGLSAAFTLTPIIDLRPKVRGPETPGLDEKCARCSFRTFVATMGNERRGALEAVHRVFEALAPPTPAYTTAGTSTIAERLTQIAAHTIYETVYPGQPATLAASRTVRLCPANQPIPHPSNDEIALVSVDRRGPAAVQDRLLSAHAAGYKKLWLGSYEHAASVEDWISFCEAPNFEVQWNQLTIAAERARLPEVRIILGFPACVLLQWPAYRAFDAMRTRLDVHFRVMDGESSLMCPENVSGHIFTHDIRVFGRDHEVSSRGFAIRYERLLFDFG